MNLLLPVYLVGLAALALPWVLHRFSHQDPTEHPFPSDRFLEPVPPPAASRKRLRHRALLALRWLALALLCLLFAEPYLDRALNTGAARQLHILAIDRSLSMRTGERWQRAGEELLARMNAVADDDLVQLLSFDQNVVALGSATSDVSLASSSLAGLQPSYAASDYGALMRRLDAIADESDLPVVATIVTDAQRSALPERLNALNSPRLASLEIVDISADDERNVALEASIISDDAVTARVRLTLTASSSGATDETVLQRTVLIEHEGREWAREQFELRPGQSRTRLLEELPLPAVEQPVFELRLLEQDSLSVDDQLRRGVTGQQSESLVIASVDGRLDADARVFVATAIETAGEATVRVANDLNDALTSDSRHAVIFVSADEQAEIESEIARFLDTGGNVLLVNRDVGDGAGASDNEAEYGSRADGQGIGRLDEAHPLALGEIDWTGARFFSNPEQPVESSERVLLEAADGRPLLVERPRQNGNLFWLNDALTGDDSNLPFHPAFVALMQNMLAVFTANTAIPRQAVAGVPVDLPANAQVLDPNGSKLLALADLGEPTSLVLQRPGLHTVVDARGEHQLFVASDPRESDLVTLDARALDAWQQGNMNPSSESLSQTSSSGEEPIAGAESSDNVPAIADDGSDETIMNGWRPESGQRDARVVTLWPWLLPILAVLLMAESLFANRRLHVRRDGS